MPQSERKSPDEVSKSSVKREMSALQKIGEELVKMAQPQLDKIPLPEKLLEAINLARSLKTHESIRRQLQYIGKIMRNVDVEPIRAAIKKAQTANARVTEQFHDAEKWREKLITLGDDAIQSFVSEFTEADRQKLRQFVRKAQHDRKTEKNTGAETELFRYLREFIK